MNDRVKFYVEFPVAQTWEEAVKCIVDGGSCWQEDSNDWPSCGGFDDLECFLENFPEKEKDDFDFSVFDVHMIPKGQENAIAEPFEVGEQVWASKDIETVTLDTPVYKGQCFKIERIHPDGTLVFEETFKSNGKDIKFGFNFSDFIRDGKEKENESKNKIFILVDISEGNLDMDSTFTSMDNLKKFVDNENIIWSDDFEDFEEIMENSDMYSGTNWDYEGVDKYTGEVLYAVQISFLR